MNGFLQTFCFIYSKPVRLRMGGGREGGGGEEGGREGGEGGGRRNEDVDGFLCSLHGIVQLDLQALREPK